MGVGVGEVETEGRLVEAEGRLWDRGTQDWAEFQEAQFQESFEDALGEAGVGPECKVLDVGCGSGLLLRLAAARGAATAGLDASQGLLDIARDRLPDGSDLRVGDLQELPYEDGEFDVLISFNALRYARDPVAAVRGFGRVVRSGGAVVLGGWGEPAKCETTAMLFDVLALLPEPPAGSGGDAANTPTEVRGAVRGAGLPIVFTKELSCPFVYPDLDTAWAALGSTGLLQHASSVVGADTVRAVFDRNFRGSVRPDGSVVQNNTCEYAIARVP
ncbi:class I SAM-dependent methyltransferase [Streptomyces sp. NPDC059002]|uniref:class I SAM-dependent methyltransferase n=1 Tax=Streptomyces sp. NPDC059002 TaxID=3346690 RepID=UPI0036D1E775